MSSLISRWTRWSGRAPLWLVTPNPYQGSDFYYPDWPQNLQVAESDLEPLILLPVPRCWDYRRVCLHSVVLNSSFGNPTQGLAHARQASTPLTEQYQQCFPISSCLGDVCQHPDKAHG